RAQQQLQECVESTVLLEQPTANSTDCSRLGTANSTLQTVPGWEQPTLQTVPGWEQTTANSTDCSRLGTARSPDLNPIEHIWDIMSRSIHQRHVAPQTVQELADALVQ
uniref:Tc1-like transposase DDE domain-containing protein n=1 Tax=Oncorhynchus tshawytscha TaxID=74940 RepID=A0AAZ3RBC1_ONCTS